MELNKIEKDLINKALKEYEENHYSSEGKAWQKVINSLMEKF